MMDIWTPFRNATSRHAPQAVILFDKFHVMANVGKALDTQRKSEYARLCGDWRRYIKEKCGVVLGLRLPSPLGVMEGRRRASE